MARKNAPVVIMRKDKRLNKAGHLLAFAITGGASSVYTAAKAASNAAYNARTRELQRQAEGDPEQETRVDRPSTTTDRLQLLAEAGRQARAELGIPAELPWRKLTREQRVAVRVRRGELLAELKDS